MPCDALYKTGFNKDMYRMAYGEVLTPTGSDDSRGPTGKQRTGLSEAEIGRITGLLRPER